MQLEVSQLTAILLIDGWHEVAAVPGAVVIDYDVSISDAATGKTATPEGGPWVGFAQADGSRVFCPVSRVQAVRSGPLQAGAVAGRV